MKRILFTITVISLLAINSCGGGSTTPTVFDLAGIAGLWNYTINAEGTLSGLGGSFPLSNTYTGSFSITSDSVIDDGISCFWSYDGSTLILSEAVTEAIDWDPVFGNSTGTFNIDMIIPVIAGETVAGITGNMQMIYLTEYIGEIAGVMQLTGNMAKQ